MNRDHSNADLPTDGYPVQRRNPAPSARHGEYEQHPSQSRHRLHESGPHTAPGWQHPPRPPRNGLGVAALVLGIIGALFGMIPLTFAIAGILGVTGLVLGLVGWARARRGEATNRRTAISGTVLSALATALATWGAVIMFQTTNQLFDDVDELLDDLDPSVTSPAIPADADALAAGTIPPGTYLVGEDVPAGTYRTDGPGDGTFEMCYWARLSGTSGEFDELIANGMEEGPATVTIRDSDAAFETRGCTWEQR